MEQDKKIALILITCTVVMFLSIIIYEFLITSSINDDCIENLGKKIWKEKGYEFYKARNFGFIETRFGVMCIIDTKLDYRETGRYKDTNYHIFRFYPEELEGCRK